MDPGADVLPTERLLDLIPAFPDRVDVDERRVKVSCVFRIRLGRSGCDYREAAECIIVAFPYLLAAVKVLLDPGELVDP